MDRHSKVLHHIEAVAGTCRALWPVHHGAGEGEEVRKKTNGGRLDIPMGRRIVAYGSARAPRSVSAAFVVIGLFMGELWVDDRTGIK